MKRNATCPVKKLFIFLVLALQTTASLAVLDKFEPYAISTVRYDSNVFRVSGDDAARAVLGTTSRDDTIAYIGAGFESALKLSRQRLVLDANVERAKYDTFDELDHTAGDGKAALVWQVGNLWSGNIGYRYKRKLRSFYQTNIPEKDIRTTNAGYMDGGYQLHPDWRLVGGVSYSEASYDERKRLNRNTASGQLEIQYETTLNTQVGLRVNYSDNDLSRETEIAGVRFSNDYREIGISGTLYWEGSAKSSFRANLGYTDQKYDDLSDRDYSGSTGRLTYNWKATGKTQLDISAWRETSTLFNEITTYVLTKGVSVGPVWSVTSKISITGLVSYTNDDFKGDNDIRVALGQQRRDDDIWLYRITASWRPRNNLSLSAGYTKEDRDSSTSAADFDDDRVEASVKFSF